MLIDFHTHIFPDKIASAAIGKLSGNSGYPPETDGTASDTLKKMADWGVDLAVVLNIATKPSQHTNVNNFASALDKDPHFVGFGSVYPGDPSAIPELERIKSLGIKGIKLHPDYQDFFADDPRVFPVYEACAALGLITVFHAGFDIFSPGVIHNPPTAMKKIADNFPELTFVAAHLGGHGYWDEVELLLTGRNLYLDTSFIAWRSDPALVKRIISKHGSERILFASDCPWQSSVENYDFIRSLGLSEDEQENIFYKNASRLLGI